MACARAGGRTAPRLGRPGCRRLPEAQPFRARRFGAFDAVAFDAAAFDAAAPARPLPPPSPRPGPRTAQDTAK